MRITHKRKIMASTDVGYNQMTIEVISGVNSDGFTITITDPSGNVLFDKDYRYGWDASYSKEQADAAHAEVEKGIKYGWSPSAHRTEKPYVTDIINDLCEKYDISDAEITVVAGGNRFTGDTMDDDSVNEFIDKYVHSCSDTITASENENKYDIFMLMDYTCGYEGMESDCFDCYGKFYATDINDAKRQLQECIRKYPDVDSEGMYVSEYNEYFDNFNSDDPYDYWSNEVFSDLDTMFSKFNESVQDYNEEFGDEPLPYTSTNTDGDDVMASEEFEDYEDEIKEIDQEFTSENTSINSTKVPAVFKMVSFEPGTVNIDVGGGKFDTAADYLTQYDVVNLVYDPYNRSKEHNQEVIKTLKDMGGADTGTCSNVLNVIKEPEARLNVLKNLSKLVKPDGKIYITVYEGTGKGNEGATKSGYQLNKKTADYLEEIQQVFPDATRKGKLIQATNSNGSSVASATKITGGLDPWLNDEYDPYDPSNQYSYQRSVEIPLDATVVVDKDGFWEFEGDDQPWAHVDVEDSEMWESDYHISDPGIIEQDVFDLLQTYIPAQEGTYNISGDVTLVYDVTSNGSDDPDDTEVNFNERASSVKNFTID